VNIILGLVVFLLIFATVAVVFFNINLIELRAELNNTKMQLELQLTQQQQESQTQIDKVGQNLEATQASLEVQLSELKASASSDFSGIIEGAVKAVVSIQTDVAQGSGFIISNEGYIITNAHVLNGAHWVRALTYEDGLKDASLIGYDGKMDVAVLKISGSHDSLEFEDSNDVKVGEKVVAIGNPLGLSFSVSEGIVSALNRPGLNNIEAYIQTDVSLNPGNSGGPLVNKKGKVIGINNFKVGNSEGLGFALEADAAVKAINQISMQALNVSIA